MSATQSTDSLQTTQSRFRYWSFYPLLLLLMFASIFLIVHGLNERQRLENEQRQGALGALPNLLEINQLQKWLDAWMASMYQYSSLANREDYLRQSSYYLDKITQQLDGLREKGLAANDINNFHQRVQNINLSVKSFERAMTINKRDEQLVQKILLGIQQEINQSQLMFKQWGEQLVLTLQGQSQTIKDDFLRLMLWQMGFALIVLTISAYLFIRLLLRWIADKRMIYQLYNQDELGVPNIRQLAHDFQHIVVLPRTRRAVLMRINILGQAELTRLFGTHVGVLSQKIIAQRLREAIEKFDPPAGVYFMVPQQWALLIPIPHLQSDDALIQAVQAWCESLLTLLEKPVELKNMTLRFTAKVGVSIYPKPASSFHLGMQQAEMALSTLLYAAPHTLTQATEGTPQTIAASQANHLAFYQDEMSAAVQQRIHEVEQLRHAVRHSGAASPGVESGLRVRYQPCVPVNQGGDWRISTRLQWRMGEQVFDSERFREIAVSSGLIVDMTDWYMQAVFRQWQAWRQPWQELGISPRQIMLSVFPRLLADRDFPARLKRLMQQHQVPVNLVTLSWAGSWKELPSEQCRRALAVLKDLGVGLMLADLGKSDIGIAELPSLAFDGLLIHGDFVANMQQGERSKAEAHAAHALASSHSLARLILNMSKDMGRWTLADNVSSISQSSLLTLWGCQFLQGSLFAPPTSAEHFNRWATAHRP